MRESIYEVKWEDLLPEVLKRDPKMAALAKAIAEQKRKIAKEIYRAQFWNQLDCLPDEILDVLAYDLHIDWYDPGAERSAKLEAIEGSVKVHKTLGTVDSVVDALAAVFAGTVVLEEWFEYGGEPYSFRVTLDGDGDIKAILKVINRSKRLSAWMDVLRFLREGRLGIYTGGAIRVAGNLTISAEEVTQEQIEEMLSCLVDELGNTLLDEDGNVLYYEEEE